MATDDRRRGGVAGIAARLIKPAAWRFLPELDGGARGAGVAGFAAAGLAASAVAARSPNEVERLNGSIAGVDCLAAFCTASSGSLMIPSAFSNLRTHISTSRSYFPSGDSFFRLLSFAAFQILSMTAAADDETVPVASCATRCRSASERGDPDSSGREDLMMRGHRSS
jgi:hypothetical protein